MYFLKFFPNKSFSLAHQAVVANPSFVGVTTTHTLHKEAKWKKCVLCMCKKFHSYTPNSPQARCWVLCCKQLLGWPTLVGSKEWPKVTQVKQKFWQNIHRKWAISEKEVNTMVMAAWRNSLLFVNSLHLHVKKATKFYLIYHWEGLSTCDTSLVDHKSMHVYSP